MVIGIDGSRAFLKRRTGIEEYSHQVIRNLRNELKDAEVVVYIRSDQEVDFELPANWRVRKLWSPRLWTQFRLSLEMLFHGVDVLFVPAHTVPFIHPKKTVVVVHGLEYEFCPKAYSLWARLYMHWSIGFSCKASSEIICVSENTKRDVMNVYKVPEDKIQVVYEGYEPDRNEGLQGTDVLEKIGSKYLLFIGRLEERKNIIRFIEAFEKVKQETNCNHKLVLAGKWGYGHEHIQKKIDESLCKQDIIVLGYVSEEEKWSLLRNADVFLFATLYEGFGIPVLEAQISGAPVITSNTSSLPEVVGEGAVLVDALSAEEISNAIRRLISDESFKNAIIQKGLENVQRFSWEKCAQEIGSILKNDK